MKTKLALLATSAIAALAIATPADAAGSSWYLSLSGGGNWINDNDFTTTGVAVGTLQDTFLFNSESETGYVIGGAVGLSLNSVMQGLRVEAEVAYRQNQVDGIWASDTVVTDPTGNDSGVLDFDHSTLAVMANVWYDFDVGGVKPYIGGGIGWAETDVDGTFIGGTVPAFNVGDNGFAWQAGAGVNFQVAPSVQLGVGYRYFAGPETAIGAPDPAANSLTSDLDSDNHSAVVTLTFGM